MTGLPLVLIPGAACAAAELRRLVRALPPGVTPLPVELPGRGRRWREPFVSSGAEAVADIAAVVEPALAGAAGYAVLGESLGAYLGLRLVERLSRPRDGGPPPRCVALFALSNSPPAAREPLRFDPDRADDDTVLGLMARLGGQAPDEVLADEELRRRFLCMVRHDMLVSQSLIATSGRAVVDTELVVITGREDRSVAEVDRWREHTRRGVTLVSMPGGHLQCRHNPATIAALVGGRLARA